MFTKSEELTVHQSKDDSTLGMV
jgi:hypothetical protein